MMLSLSGPATPHLRILALGAHCDDIEIGAGGLLMHLAEHRALELHAVVLTSDTTRARETHACLSALAHPHHVEAKVHDLPDARLPAHWDRVKDILAPYGRHPWDVVLAPHRADAHQDHALVGALAPTTFRDHLILYYEIPKWDGDLGALGANVYLPLTARQVARKWELLNQHFPSQHPHDWWDREVFSGLARLRGVECRQTYAEAFHTDKILIHL